MKQRAKFSTKPYTGQRASQEEPSRAQAQMPGPQLLTEPPRSRVWTPVSPQSVAKGAAEDVPVSKQSPWCKSPRPWDRAPGYELALRLAASWAPGPLRLPHLPWGSGMPLLGLPRPPRACCGRLCHLSPLLHLSLDSPILVCKRDTGA